MPITRSHENLMNLEEPANVSFSIDVGASNGNQGARPKKRNANSSVQNSEPNPRPDNDNRTRQIINNSLESFRIEMMSFMTNELRTIVQDMNSQPVPNQRPTERNFPIETGRSPSRNFDRETEPFLADRVLNIIRNWKIKFTGHDNMSVDEFIYRVNILTTNNLKGDFEMLCRYAHSLFEGKALEWYWRYHRQANEIDWQSLTNALRTQYKDDYTDFDILEDIRRRKQKYNENFDEYFNDISAMTDRLKISISDRDLCETVIRNLRTEIRHELLHLEIGSVSQLRREVKRHEKFMKDVHAYETRKSNKGRISELTNDDSDIDHPVDNHEEICTIQQNLTCWNCTKQGHTYFDCLETRQIFCYGCGAKNIYRPNCTKCCKKSGNGLKDVRRTF